MAGIVALIAGLAVILREMGFFEYIRRSLEDRADSKRQKQVAKARQEQKLYDHSKHWEKIEANDGDSSTKTT